jgi:hypothetical protein
LAAFTTYFWFLPQEMVKYHGLKYKQYFDVYWNRVAFMQIIAFTYYGITNYIIKNEHHDRNKGAIYW